MVEPSERDAAVLGDWARLLLGTLARVGVDHVIISPGSRSTPFAWAALETPGITCHSVIDERSAGFFALGQARITGRPSLLLCTSGSAATHYFPAIVEASQAAVPLLALTADRPFELQAAGAPQTLDQAKLYGDHVRGFFELGHPQNDERALDGLMRLAAQAVQAALGPEPGPVHLNAKARKPLEPAPGQALSPGITRRLERGPTRIKRVRACPSPEDVSELVAACVGTKRGLIVCGPVAPTRAADASALFALARATGYPLFVEAVSQARFRAEPGVPVIGGFEMLSRSGFVDRMAPELILVLGATPVSGELERRLSSESVRYSVITPHAYQDSPGRARSLLFADPFESARVLAEELSRCIPPEALSERRALASEWQRQDDTYFELVERVLSDGDRAPFTEPKAVQIAVDALPRGGLLGLGNGLPVREVDAFVRPRDAELTLWCQRGLSGIDGLVSGAIGAASVGSAPSMALIGDVSFLHDLGGLALAREVTSPLALVVVDNDGGRIFENLPVARLFAAHPERARYWLTPGGFALDHAAAVYGVPYTLAEDARSFREALKAALARPGCSLVHARVVPDSNRAVLGELSRLLSES